MASLSSPGPEPGSNADLIRRLGHFDFDVRQQAIHEIDAKVISDPEVRAKLGECVDDDNYLIAVTAINWIHSLKCAELAPAVEETLRKSWGRYSDFKVKRPGDPRGPNKTEYGPVVRAAALRALGTAKYYPALALVLEVLEMDVQLNKLLAVETLGKFGKPAKDAIPQIIAYAREWVDPGSRVGIKPFEFDQAWENLLHYIPLGALQDPIEVAISALEGKPAKEGIGVDAPAVREFLEQQILHCGRHSCIAFNALTAFLWEKKDYPALVNLYSEFLVRPPVLQEIRLFLSRGKRDPQEESFCLIMPIAQISVTAAEYPEEIYIPLRARLEKTGNPVIESFLALTERRLKRTKNPDF